MDFYIRQRFVLAFMGFMGLVNAYTMRVCLSLAITKISPPKNKTTLLSFGDQEYDWSEELQGWILSSFYIGYLITHLPGGILCEKFGGKYVLSLGILSTAIFTLITPACIYFGGAPGLIFVRILTGLGEGTTFPALSALLSQWAPPKERAKMGSLVLGGGQIGSVVALTISGELLDLYKWDIVFYFFGTMAIIWFIIFTIICSSDPATHPFISEREREYLVQELGSIERKKDLPPIPWKAIITSAPMLALISAQIGHDFGFYIMVSDLPKYMKSVLNLDVKKNGYYNAILYACMWVSSLSSAAAADYFISKTLTSITFQRKFWTVLAAVGPGIFMVLATYFGTNRFWVVSCFVVAMTLMGPYYAGMKLGPLDMSPNYAGSVMAMTNGIGSVAGILAPVTVGYILSEDASIEEWRLVMLLTFAIFLITSIIYGIWASGEIQPWNDPESMKAERQQQ